MSSTTLALGSNAVANTGSVVMNNRSKNSSLHNKSVAGIVINDVSIPFGFLSGQNVNLQLGGGTSNKNSVVFK